MSEESDPRLGCWSVRHEEGQDVCESLDPQICRHPHSGHSRWGSVANMKHSALFETCNTSALTRTSHAALYILSRRPSQKLHHTCMARKVVYRALLEGRVYVIVSEDAGLT
jgi:hypothetical protein